jgi:hypothetical protein
MTTPEPIFDVQADTPTVVEFNGEQFEVFGHVQIFDRDIFNEAPTIDPT